MALAKSPVREKFACFIYFREFGIQLVKPFTKILSESLGDTSESVIVIGGTSFDTEQAFHVERALSLCRQRTC